MDTPHGPRVILGNRQVAIPDAVLTHAGIKRGDEVYFLVSDVEPHVIKLVSGDTLRKWVGIGQAASGTSPPP